MVDILKQTDKFNNAGEGLSKKLKEKIPIIYASQALGAIAFRWKTQINENAKMPAFYNVFSEMNHNEIAGYKSMDRKFAAVIIRDKYDNERIKKRMDVCKEIMEVNVDVEEVQTEGESLLARMFSAIYLGDYVSYYMALWNRVDPSPVDIIEGINSREGLASVYIREGWRRTQRCVASWLAARFVRMVCCHHATGSLSQRVEC